MRLLQSAPAVQVWSAPIALLGGRAVHTHFLYARPAEGWMEQEIHRVEVWQRAQPPGGHLWVDQNAALLDQGRGLCLLGERSGPPAEEVIATLEAAMGGTYPWTDLYLPVPGPNSNTFTAEILRRAGWPVVLPPQAIGRRFLAGGR